ncbi:MAG: tetratricopeptide repeat protein [Candidatus Hodarchaeales archaeon]|jgi:tetratricopeptide (TPR) repeat protein
MDNKELDQEPKILNYIRHLIDEGKFEKSFQLLEEFEENKENTLHSIAYSHLLKCKLLYQHGLYRNVVNLAKQTYNESLKVGQNLISIDALMIMTKALARIKEVDKAFDIINQVKEQLKTLTQQSSKDYKQKEADFVFLKGFFYFFGKNDVDRALKHFENSLVLREKLGAKLQIAESLTLISWLFATYKGELSRALKYGKRGLAIAKESNEKYQITTSLNVLGIIYGYRGELDESNIYFEQSLEISKKYNFKHRMANVLNNLGDNYRMRGEFDHALECLEQSLVLRSELGDPYNLAIGHDFLIQMLIEKGDLNQAQRYLSDLTQINNQLKDNVINLLILFNKALILKKSPRAHDHGKAEEILKRIINDRESSHELTIGALLNLCELLLIELHKSNDLEVFSEIESLITRMTDTAENSQSYWILGESYLLLAKLALISLDLNGAQLLLTQGQKIAEKYGLNLLSMKISHEHDKLMKQLDR